MLSSFVDEIARPEPAAPSFCAPTGEEALVARYMTAAINNPKDQKIPLEPIS